MIIDTHAHLTDPVFDSDREDVLKRARDAHIEYIIAVSYDLETAKKSVTLAQQYDFIVPSLGIHPHAAQDYTGSYKEEFERLFNENEKVAVGEVGLDFYRDISPREVQRAVFDEFLAKSVECSLPLIIHNRDADTEIYEMISRYPKGSLRGVFHCFSSTYEFAKKVIDLGFYISFAGPLTFTNAHDLRDAAKHIPIERILLETDSPYLAPQRYRGKRNEPSYITFIAEQIAQLKGLSVEDVSRITTFNARNIFRIGTNPDHGEIAYKIRDALYLNITNACTNACTFCVRYYTDYVKGHNLKLETDPSYDEIIAAIGDPKQYKEIVFCGFGEPLLRLDIIKKVAAYVKEHGVKVRIDTNGHGNLIHKRSIVGELKGLVDTISVSLNAESEKEYNRVCQPKFETNVFEEVKKFVLACKEVIPSVVITVVDQPGIDVEKCRHIASDELGVPLRVRTLNEVG